VTIERPLRLRSQFNALLIDEMLYDKGELELSKWLYQTYGEKVFTGLDAEMSNIKEYLNDNEIKMTDKKLAKLVSAKDWKDRRDLMNTAKQLMHAIGTEVYMDFNAFSEKIATTAKALKLDVKTTTLNVIARAMSVTDPEARPVIKKRHHVGSKDVASLVDTFGVDEKRLADYGFFPGEKGSYVCQYVEYEPDSDLRDTEKIPVKEDIYDYFQREVRPYVADAWINLPPTKIGCEISFNKYFYKPAPLRTLEENERDILELDRQSQGFIQSLFK
jgi:type I restriction enzyme M protein